MVSTSLAAQLSKGVSLNASFLADRSRRKHVESYLFTSREADQHDYHSLHALGVNGLSKLKALDRKFTKYDGNLFSDAARDLDRTLQSESQNAELNRILGSFLRDLGPYVLESPTSKVLEWVVRRFRVNEFNVDHVMALFLPYHETAQFTKMVSILHVMESNLWYFLAPLKAAAKPLPRSLLVHEMAVNRDLARFVVTLLPEALGAGQTYPTLTGFTASITMDYFSHLQKVDEETVAFVLSSIIRAFSPDSNQDAALAGYFSLAALSQRCRFSPQGLLAVLSQMAKGQQYMKSQQILPFFIAFLAPQDQLDEFPDSDADSIINLSGFQESLIDCLSYVGIERVVVPLLPRLIQRSNETIASDILDSLLTSPLVMKVVVERTTHLLLINILQSNEALDSVIRRLLTVIFQRHGPIFSETSLKLLAMARDGDDQQLFEQVLRSVAVSPTRCGDQGKLIVSSGAADPASRINAVRELVNTLSMNEVKSENYIRACDALRSRVMDTDVTVVEILYSNLRAVLPVFSDLLFIKAVSRALAAPDVSRPIMRLHLTFVARDLCPECPEFSPEIFERIFLPYLLFTKPRQKTAALVWQMLNDSYFSQFELLNGCTDIVQTHPVAEGASRSIDQMTVLNLGLTSCIAGNIIRSNAYPRHLGMLLRLLNDSNAHTINICYLILRSLLNQLSGEHQVEAAQRILSSMRVQSLDVLQGVMAKATTLQEVISDDLLLKSVILKPSSPGTIHRLQVAILALLPIVQQPVDVKINWLGGGTSGSSDKRGKRFVELAHTIYALTNSCSTTHFLSTSLLKALFVNLREQTLVFLADVWTTSILSDVEPDNLPLAALFHGAAFLRAQVTNADHPHDFQVILPSLLIALRSTQRAVRTAAMECIAIISQCSPSSTAPPVIYALDSVYGSSSSVLQYLAWLDLCRFVSSLNNCREHFINDSDYLGVFAQEMLCKVQSDKKKESGYKQRVLCYLLSHAVAWNSIPAKVGLLEMLKNVPHRVKLQIILPLLQTIVSGDQTLWGDEYTTISAAYFQLLLGAYDITVISELVEPGSGSWTTFVRLMNVAFTHENIPACVHKAILHQLCNGLFESLTMDLKREICINLIEHASFSPTYQHAIKDTMGTLIKETPLIASLLLHFQPTEKDSSQRASKRPKLIPNSGVEESTLRPMTILAEILVERPMPGSVELISTSLDALTRVFHAHSSQSDANYIMQLLMSMLDSVASSISDHNTLTLNSVRMEVLVEILRVSDNPQTFNQALLLIANLARLAPEFAMQSVMPVFTFMGSNVFHRDDSYSFRVVQKTIDCIVPVVITSLKTKHPGSLALQLASRDFLRVFTDAATHVPRHRRTQFFIHLVEVLGRDEFAVSICLLLVDKIANKVVRKKPGEVANTLSLPLSVLQTNPKAVPFEFIEQFLQETARLLNRLNSSDPVAHDAFLPSLQDVDQSTSLSNGTRKQIEAILIFVELALHQSSRKGDPTQETTIQESVRLLLNMANLGHDSTTSTEFSDVSRAAMKALGQFLRVISASEFVAIVSTILASENPTLAKGAMNLLASRLRTVTSNTRHAVSPTITRIVDSICSTMNNTQEVSNFPQILNALRAVAETADARELPVLTKALPLVITAAMHQKRYTAEVLECLLPISIKLGPRILPVFRDLVGFCTNVLRDAQSDSDGSRIEHNAQVVLITLLSSISQFWSVDELIRLGKLSLETGPTFLSLRKTVAKRIPAKQLLPALFRIWSELAATQSSSWSARDAFFDLLRRAVRIAPRDDIHDHLREIFKLFLDAFELCSRLNRQEIETFETLTMTTFVDVVTKLNEATFKPLFRRLFDWAFNSDTGDLINRQITFSRVLMALIKLLKSLVTPYMIVALVPLTNILDSYSSNRKQSEILWTSTVDLFQTSFAEDEGAFWRTDKLRKLIPTFIAQVEICTSLGTSETKQALKSCLGAMVTIMEDDSSLKKLNLELLMQTRSDNAQTRLFALQCAEHLWNEHSNKLAGFVSDVVSFIAESADDEHDEVAKAARGLKRTIENKRGSLDGLMQ